ncbi:MAG: hypothetical protein HQM02_04630 [Magnetococcales bacterium]|nr:hypothetical protein [Magnetococcales bacterium]
MSGSTDGKHTGWMIGGVLAGLFGAVSLAQGAEVSSPPLPRDARAALVYKSPYCGCCTGYVDFLKEQGVAVEVESVMDMEPVKRSLGIGKEMESCHTTRIGGYIVEGHVPLHILRRLLTEKPDIPGIALPGMPTGVPGMPGAKVKWTVYTLETPPRVFAEE